MAIAGKFQCKGETVVSVRDGAGMGPVRTMNEVGESVRCESI